jgi:serine/threonine-protein kinase
MIERAIPRKIGRYRIDGLLGEGAMAVVYAGFDPDIEREVAIKCLHQDVATDPGYRRRFLVEARAAGRLTHPNIVTIFDVGETDDGSPYIAMERLPGETLASRVANEGFPPLAVVMDLAGQVAAALDYAHAHGIVHHDIKPENIMLVDGWQHAKVNDFGIAERRDVAGDVNAQRIEIGGTPAYMAPEHLRGEPTDGRSDLFSLGVMLYWLITGKLPWRETSDARQMLRERQRLPWPSTHPRDPSTPLLLVDIVHTLLAPSAKERYQHGSEVVDDLQLARREYARLHEQPLATRIISLRLRWAGILGVLLSLTLLLGLTAISAKQNVAITGVALDFGGSLGRMIASESAENLLLGDHAATRALVDDIARNQQIDYLAIADRYGNVIASTQRDQVGGKLPTLTGQKHLSRLDGVESYRIHTAGGADPGGMLVFDVPIHYQSAAVGDLHLGISDRPLRAAQRTILWVIASVLMVTLAVVVGTAYWLSRRLLTLMDLLGRAMLRVARGDFRHRIRLVRRDELGHLFAVFNLMNDALQTRQRQPHDDPAKKATVAVAQPTQIMPVPGAAESDITRPPD